MGKIKSIICSLSHLKSFEHNRFTFNKMEGKIFCDFML
jgi:hypothetical protein